MRIVLYLVCGIVGFLAGAVYGSVMLTAAAEIR